MSEETKPIMATVTKVRSESTGLLAATLDVESEVSAAYDKPGQYLVLHPDGQEKPVFMALASAPGAPTLELLIGSPASEKLGLTEGQQIPIDAPAGKGYPIDLARGKNLILFGVGSGLSAMRSVIEYVRNHRSDFKNVNAYFGAHTEEAHAYRDLDEAWAEDGINIHRTNSKPWIQDVFRADSVDVDDTIAFVCGMKEMVAGVTEALVEAGLPEELVRQNY
jgi:sulfhydrogenase subunit gamma (sulfur reductase)